MAVTNSVLVNDGGAPARIINLEAATAITAGMCLEVNSSGKLLGADTDNQLVAGFALVDAAAGDLVSMVTGSGVILRMICKADVARGNNLMVDEAVAGSCLLFVEGSNNIAQGIALEAGDGGLTKCLVF